MQDKEEKGILRSRDFRPIGDPVSLETNAFYVSFDHPTIIYVWDVEITRRGGRLLAWVIIQRRVGWNMQ